MTGATGTGAAVLVVVRTRDRPVLLARALADVCAQTFPDWHLVVVDDGGDATEVDRLVEECPGLTGRVTVLHNDVGRGMEAAANQGVGALDAEFVAIHDDDDTWHPAFLERTVAHLRTSDDVAVAVRTEMVSESIDGDAVVERGREVFSPDVHSFTLFDLLRSNRFVPISVVYRRRLLEDLGPFREDLPVVGDWEFHLRLAQSGHAVGFLDGEPLAFWHQRPEARGTDANSVIDRSDEHLGRDLEVRDAALRDYVRQHGAGGLLYVTRYFQREIDLLHEHVERVHARAGEVPPRLQEIERALAAQGATSARTGEVLEQLVGRLDRLETAVSDASLVSLLRRRYRRWKARVQGLARRG
ncbi:glycosyltransferase family 2 protein [Petropleomorpha daqingensis]|uniref:Glycosyltransferase involved in cell wall biosynthesis n=1 Tax=Petropleomorpha daqingensis TaxID=2026353 RepID=A0A853CJB1_9ACTN|nr:glycosyltransferase involved in cell wall biosynthesis [Petropleomorpha daqingensis]